MLISVGAEDAGSLVATETNRAERFPMLLALTVALARGEGDRRAVEAGPSGSARVRSCNWNWVHWTDRARRPTTRWSTVNASPLSLPSVGDGRVVLRDCHDALVVWLGSCPLLLPSRSFLRAVPLCLNSRLPFLAQLLTLLYTSTDISRLKCQAAANRISLSGIKLVRARGSWRRTDVLAATARDEMV